MVCLGMSAGIECYQEAGVIHSSQLLQAKENHNLGRNSQASSTESLIYCAFGLLVLD